MPGEWDPSKHPRADDGQFGEGSGDRVAKLKAKTQATKAKTKALKSAAKKVKALAAKAKSAAAKQKLAAAQAKAKTKAAGIVAAAKDRAKALVAKAKSKKVTGKTKDAKAKSRAKIKQAVAKAKQKAFEVVEKAKDRAKGIVGKAKGAKAKTDTRGQAPTNTGQVQSRSSANMPNPADVRSSVVSDKRRSEISNGLESPPFRRFSGTAQSAIREHHNGALAKYGLRDRDSGLVKSRSVEIRSERDMFGAAGLHYQHDGNIVLSDEMATALAEHSKLDEAGLRDVARRAIGGGDPKAFKQLVAYSVSTHEALHGHGPSMLRVGPHTMIEELSTEMAARQITADVHDIPVHVVPGAYGKFIQPTAQRMQELSGVYGPAAMQALARASIIFKRGDRDQMSPDDGLRQLAANAMKELGMSDPASHDALFRHMYEVSEKDP